MEIIEWTTIYNTSWNLLCWCNVLRWIRCFCDVTLSVYCMILLWASIPKAKVVGSNPTVARHIFQACPVWIYTQSNITQAIYNTFQLKCNSCFKSVPWIFQLAFILFRICFTFYLGHFRAWNNSQSPINDGKKLFTWPVPKSWIFNHTSHGCRSPRTATLGTLCQATPLLQVHALERVWNLKFIPSFPWKILGWSECNQGCIYICKRKL
jgi:hypothetical protein